MTDHIKLSQMQIEEAVGNLNEALDHAHRIGLRSQVLATDQGDLQKVKVVLMRPARLKISNEKVKKSIWGRWGRK